MGPVPMSRWAMAVGVVELPDGRRLRGRGLGVDQVPAEAAEFALHLTGLRPPPAPWPSVWVPWPEFGLPWSTVQALDAIRDAYRRSATQRVEVACGSGTGRTGSVLAVLATLSGVPSETAVTWVRTHYRSHAVETPWQRRWVRRAARSLAGRPVDATGSAVGARGGRACERRQ